MCGIYAIFNHESNSNINWSENFMKGINRGPDKTTTLSLYNNKLHIGFHRLSINGIDEKSDQPIKLNDIILICNGEIYNYKEIYNLLNIKPSTNSDCEVIIHLYEKYGIEHTLQIIDGVFAFILIDTKKNNIFVSRDPYGVRPLFYFKGPQNKMLFSSDLKMINEYAKVDFYELKQFNPGHYLKIRTTNILLSASINLHNSFFISEKFIKYTSTSFSCSVNNLVQYNYDNIYNNINVHLKSAIKKRCLNSDREVACLLSGGLDSSLVCAIANQYITNLKTFSIGLKDSVDIIYAREVAKYLKTDHHEIIVSEDDFFNAIPEVIYNIESYDTTTVRASVGNYLVSKYIKENTNCKVILNGDGADELCGGYLYFSNCNDPFEFDKECKRLLHDICYFDVLRSDKSISSNGLEPRTPFLDRTFVQYYLSISPFIRCDSYNNNIGKYLIRKSFEHENLLPSKVLWRKKEAFSDGVSGYNKSWATIIQEKIEFLDENILENMTIMMEKINYNIPTTKEQEYYRYIFEKHFPYCEKIIPYFWMPKYTNAKDSSARTLNIYNNEYDNIQDFIDDKTNWNVSNVTNMSHMFSNSNFNQNISNWNVSNEDENKKLSYDKDEEPWDQLK